MTKQKTSSQIKPVVHTEITIFERDLLEILGAKHIMCNYISEGNATIKEFWGKSNNRI